VNSSAATEKLLTLQINNTQDKVFERIETLKTYADAADQILMIQVNKTYNMTREGLGDLEAQVKDLQEKSESLVNHQLEILSSTAEENSYRRGLEHDKRGEFKAAIAAYEEALKINSSYGEAYMGRGLVYAQTGQKQMAINDLRTAAKLFFESGDLDKYHLAREHSEQIHRGDTVSLSESSETIAEVKLAVDELFV
ncbi:MAG: tetratricopeptide repeat protein, partial [Thermosynechococcaceae cyanobacterium]